MALWTRRGFVLVAAAVLALSGALTARQQPSERLRPSRPDFDIRDHRPPESASARARGELRRASAPRDRRGSRLDANTGALRMLDLPGLAAGRTGAAGALRTTLAEAADRLGLDDGDLSSLSVVRDYVSRSTGVRHVTFAQAFDGIPVFGGAVTVHIDAGGVIVRVTSSAARGEARQRARTLAAEDAAMVAATDIDATALFRPVRVGLNQPGAVQEESTTARFARGHFRRDVVASLVWFAMDGGLRLAWHVALEPGGLPQFYDVLIDAASGELLQRRNRVLDGNGSGRVVQSRDTQALDPRRPDQSPLSGGVCPPPVNHELRDLTAPFRDSAAVLFDGGRLSGNNVHVFRGDSRTEGALGAFDGTRWLFDFPFNSAASAETALFFALNFAHDFFYDLGFDEAAGNFQASNFSRGGVGGDPIAGVARANGRNNATFQTAPDGTSPVISMFLWDGAGCWSEDVDGDGIADLDGDYDTDIVLHEFHHGVSHRLNTAFNGNEAGAIGEGASDFFAYSVNGDTTLAEYGRPGGLRAINGKTYNDWTCIAGFFCEPHDNGEIWANVLWDVRERFRLDFVRGSEGTAINEVHQLYIDGLTLSPPSPTMLDLRDAMLEADALRNPGSPSVNFCRLWESFAARGMGRNATDTADNGFNQVGPNYEVPGGCTAPPGPPAVTLAVTTPTVAEAGTANGTFTIGRALVAPTALTVNFTVSGTAARGTDYITLPVSATIPGGATSVDVPVVPIDDSLLEANETVVLTLRAGAGYVVGGPAVGTVTIVSDDVAPDLTVIALTVPAIGGAGLALAVVDTTRNQGTGSSAASTTSFYLSLNALIDAGDELLGTHAVPALSPGAGDTATTALTVPSTTGTGSFWIIAKADGPGTSSESIETNNTRVALVRIGPDLAITALTAPATAGAGTTIVVSDTTRNQGGGDAGASATRFYLSANLTLDAADVPLQARTVGPVAPGIASGGVTNVTIPTNVASGSLFIIAVADDAGVVPESAETNNTRFVQIRIGPDLSVSSLTAPLRAAAGTTISITEAITNTGAGAAGASITAFYLSSNLVLDASDIRLAGARNVGTLAAGASSLGTTIVALPPLPPGTYYLAVNADDGRQVTETLETNNARFTAIYLGPDLTISLANAPLTATAGATVMVADTVRNFGAEAAGPSTTRFYLSLNLSLDADDIPLAAQRAVPALGANQANAGSTTVTIPAGLSGRYILLVVADGLAAVSESSEVNNVLARQITINPTP